MERRLGRVSQAQRNILLNFLERNPRLVRTRVNNSNIGRIETERLWKELADLLNRDRTGMFKTPKDWCLYVRNYKSRLKKEAAQISSYTRTGAGPPPRLNTLNSTAQRMLALMRQEEGSSATGVCVDPSPDKQELQQASTSAAPQSTHGGVKEEQGIDVIMIEDSPKCAEPQASSSTVSPGSDDAPPACLRRRVRRRRFRPRTPDNVSRKILSLLQRDSEQRAQRYSDGVLIAQSISRLADIVDRYVAHVELEAALAVSRRQQSA